MLGYQTQCPALLLKMICYAALTPAGVAWNNGLSVLCHDSIPSDTPGYNLSATILSHDISIQEIGHRLLDGR